MPPQADNLYLVRSTCRSCEGTNIEVVFALGDMPLPEALLLPSQLEQVERRYPLDLAFCHGCALVQLLQTVPPGEIYDDRYQYLSGASKAYVEHAQAVAEQLIHDRWLDGNSVVMEIGSNDGTMLRNFQARGVATLGIDPAPVPASEARRAGIATLPTFFTRELANQLAAEGRRADVIIANNVLPNVPDLHGCLAGIRTLLKEDGILLLELPYLRDIIDNGSFDAISHEHLCYFSVTSLATLLENAGLLMTRVERIPIHGGSLQVTASKQQRHSEAHFTVRHFLEEERKAGVASVAYYDDLARRAELTKLRLLGLLDEVKAGGKSIVGYGAAARATTMLNYCGVGETYLDCVVDLSGHKQGRFIPGVHLPVLHPDRLVSNRPDYVLLLARGCREEILSQQQSYLDQGGRLIVPGPDPAII